MGLRLDACGLRRAEVHVALCRGQIRMPCQFLGGTSRRALHREMRTESVTQYVDACLGNAGHTLRAAVAWGVVPFMVAFAIGFPLMQFFVRTPRSKSQNGRGDQPQLAVVGVGFAFAVLIVLAGSVWTWVRTALTIAETHAISAWRGFMCMLAWQTVPALATVLASLVVGRIVG